MSVRKTHSLAGDLVKAWCFDLASIAAEALDVAVTQIVGEDKDDVGPRRRLARRGEGMKKLRDGEQQQHHGEPLNALRLSGGLTVKWDLTVKWEPMAGVGRGKQMHRLEPTSRSGGK